MRGFRAKDADRDRCIELIEAAYVDGQIGDADRELRVGRALSAETLDELQTLTRDLQPPAGLGAPATAPGAGSAPAPAPSLVPRLVGGAFALFFVGVALFIGVIAVTMFVALDGDSSSDSGTAFESIPADPDVSVDEQEQVVAPSFAMTPGQVRAFLDAYEDQFGTLDVLEAGFYPERVGVEVPVRGSRPRMERWSWTGEWRQDTEASAVTGPGGTIDLGTVDVRRLFANIDKARKTLRVQRGQLTHVLVNRWFDDQPSVNIYIANQFNEGGYLKTTPSGDVVRAFPYEG